MPEIQVTHEHAGERLDRFLTLHIALSRSQIQKLIRDKTILVNRAPTKSNRILALGDVIFYPEVALDTHEKDGPTPILDVVYQDNDLLVINKPAGLLVHEALKDERRPTAVDALVELFPDISTVGEDKRRPGIVHRLDKDVSGLMVIAKTQEAFESLKRQFQERTIIKEYLALVYGSIPKDHDVIRLNIERSKTKGHMIARSEPDEGKEAITEYDVLERLPTTSYLKVRIHTGRTHQIRVHLQAIGYPIVGDKLYTVRHMKFHPIDLNRLFLHSHRLTIRLLDGNEKTFEAPLPNELQLLLRKLQNV
jgi:23S rRNA pseudouridine1911/1915/1917 synthase